MTFRPGWVRKQSVEMQIARNKSRQVLALASEMGAAKDAEIATLTARVEHYKAACITTSNEVTRVLGEALYGPNPDAWSTHTPEAIADEAAGEIGRLRAKVEALEAALRDLQHRPDRCPDCGAEYAALQADTERLRAENALLRDALPTEDEWLDGESALSMYAETSTTSRKPAWNWALRVRGVLRAKVEALEPSDDVIELIRVAIDPGEPRLSGSCRAMVDVWLNRVSAARKGGSDGDQ